MGSTPISTVFLLTSLTTVGLLEALGWAVGSRIGLPNLWLVAAVRASQAWAVMALAARQTGGLHTVGLDRANIIPGFRQGLIWSVGFAAVAGVLFLILLAIGQQPLTMIRTPLPTGPFQPSLYFLVGGIVAPVAEEIVFRGIIFGYLRRWGVPAAVLISTALFGALHLPTIPVTQIVGGVVFAVAYHRSGSLMTPITIHLLGNLAIFTLSLPLFQTL